MHELNSSILYEVGITWHGPLYLGYSSLCYCYGHEHLYILTSTHLCLYIYMCGRHTRCTTKCYLVYMRPKIPSRYLQSKRDEKQHAIGTINTNINAIRERK